jgi:hypothetical protein
LDGALWLFDSIQYIDFNYDCFIEESLAIMQVTYGGFDFKTLYAMPFDLYNRVAKRANELLPKGGEE